jgi:hypothetical protein
MSDFDNFGAEPRDPLAGLPADEYERALAFRNALVAGCEGWANLDERLYRTLRKEFMAHSKLGPLLPPFVRSCVDVRDFWALIKDHDGQWEPRRKFVRKEFAPMLQALEAEALEAQQSAATVKALPQSVEEDRPSEATHAAASRWTGRTTIKEQCEVIRRLVPVAVAGLETLIAEQERRLHNQPPEPLEAEAMAALKTLHVELTELLALAEEGCKSLGAALGKVRASLSSAFRIVKETGELLVGGLPVSASASLIGWGTFAMCRTVIHLDPETSGTMAAMAGGAAAAGAMRKKSS